MLNLVNMLDLTLFSPGDKVVVAVSGGVDSVALAQLLANSKTELKLDLHIAHVNHQLRGNEASEDASFVARFAQGLVLPYTLLSVRPRKSGGKSLQGQAREMRYQELSCLCQKLGATKLAVAHHRGDQVETILLNLLRGSGPKGLQGMPRQRELSPGVILVRPLLKASRDQILSYCQNQGLAWREDSTNAKECYRRNRIRHHLIPILREYNPGIEKVLLHTSGVLQGELALLDQMCRPFIKEVLVPSPLSFAPQALLLEKLLSMPVPLRRRAVLALEGTEILETRHLDQVLALAEASTGSELDLPGNLKAYRLFDRIAIGKANQNPEPGQVPVTLPGETSFGGNRISLVFGPMPGALTFWLPRPCPSLFLSKRKPGDRLTLSGGTKKLKEILIDRKIPRWLRDQLVTLRTETDLIWVEKLGINQRFTRPATGWQQVSIKFYKSEEV